MIASLTASILVNAYQFSLIVTWQEAWLEQVLTTSNIETLYRKSGADISYEAVKTLVKSELGDFEIVPSTATDGLFVSLDQDVILVSDTKLFFKGGEYAGSKAKLPEDLSHWGFGVE